MPARPAPAYDPDAAAAMLAALLGIEPERRLATLAVVCKILCDGYLELRGTAAGPRPRRIKEV